ncbi:Di-copper centre-containing protein [Venturia nashicola]|nr:Di-copper centre-containing protein [Venturia nashicola]
MFNHQFKIDSTAGYCGSAASDMEEHLEVPSKHHPGVQHGESLISNDAIHCGHPGPESGYRRHWPISSQHVEECDYTGAQPYWDWTQDTPEHNTHFNISPVFDAQYGFGGTGAGGSITLNVTNVQNAMPPPINIPPAGNCIDSGPFNGLMHNAGPGFQLQTPNPRCMVRNIQTALADDTLQWKNDIMPVLAIDDYSKMSFAMDVPPTGKARGIHGGGHWGINGDMSNPWSSINDPLFFMHHTMIDYIWWTWQNRAPQNLYAMAGPIYPNGTGLTTLEYTVSIAPFIAPDVSVRELMDSRNRNGEGVLCFVYEDNGMPVPQKRILIARDARYDFFHFIHLPRRQLSQ